MRGNDCIKDAVACGETYGFSWGIYQSNDNESHRVKNHLGDNWINDN